MSAALKTSPAAPDSSLGDAPDRAVAATSVRWSAVSAFGQQAGRVAVSLVLARLLGPAEYGIITQAGIYLTLVALLLGQGLSSALVQRKTIDQEDMATVLWINIGSGLALAALTWFAAPFLEAFFHTPGLSWVLRGLSPAVLLKALNVVPEAIIIRRLEFRRLAMLNLISLGVGGVAAAIVARKGGGAWCFVAMVLGSEIATCVGLGVRFSWRIPRGGSRSSLGSMRRFASNLLGFQLLNFASRNLDNIIVARVLGSAALALYALSYRTMMMAIENLAWLVNRVTFPLYSRIQDDRVRLRNQFLVTTQLVALVAFPAMGLVVVLAPVAVPFIFGPAWRPAVLPMQVLAVTGMRQSVQSLVGPVFMATGRTDWQFRWQILSGAVYAGSFLVGVRWGIVGVAVAYSAVGLMLQPGETHLIGRILGFRLSEYMRVLIPPIVGTLAATASAAATLAVFRELNVPTLLTLLACSASAGGAHLGTLRLGWPEEFREARAVGRLLAHRTP